MTGTEQKSAPDLVVEVRDLHRHYQLPREKLFENPRKVYAVNGVSFDVARGKSLGIVGESGCGKSTLARAVMALEPVTSGSVRILGEELTDKSFDALRPLRREFQMVFQDPYGSLNPHHTVGRIVAESLSGLMNISRAERDERVAEALESVGLKRTDTPKYPHEFSGGQRQRIAIARALITRPALIVADEPVSALDVSVQAQVLNLLQDLQASFGVTYMLISHDLAVVEYVCDEVAVMYLGKIVEQGATSQIFAHPAHPYTRALLDAVPQPTGRGRSARIRLAGTVASQTSVATGCTFADRCPMARASCHEAEPPLRQISAGHRSACFFAEDVESLRPGKS